MYPKPSSCERNEDHVSQKKGGTGPPLWTTAATAAPVSVPFTDAAVAPVTTNATGSTNHSFATDNAIPNYAAATFAA
ncbi:MAG: hypothetical protein WBZ33_02850 [Thermoactinomyces sp.]